MSEKYETESSDKTTVEHSEESCCSEKHMDESTKEGTLSTENKPQKKSGGCCCG